MTYESTPREQDVTRRDRAPQPHRLRAGRLATAGAFAMTGLVFATWAARIPARKAELGLSDGDLAIAFVGLNAGAVVGLQLGAVVVTRIGSRSALAVGLPAFAAMLVPVAHAPSLATLSIALGASALANGVVDVAINDQGVGVQHWYGRSLLSGLHAMHSLGAVLGGGIAAGLAAAGVGLGAHFLGVAAAVTALGILCSRALLPPDRVHQERERGDRPPGPAWRAGWNPALLMLGLLAFVFTLAEGSALDWSAVLLREGRDSSAAMAAAALAVFQAAVTCGRLAGDRLIDRFGPSTVFATGALVAGVGFLGGLLLGSAWGAVLGLAMLGLGLSTLLPIVITAAGARGSVPVPVAVARVSTLGYLGSFAGPLLVGVLAHASDLPTALMLPAVAVALTATAARAVRVERGNRGG